MNPRARSFVAFLLTAALAVGSLSCAEAPKGHDHEEEEEGPHGKPKSYRPEQLIDARPVDASVFPFLVDDFEGADLKKWRNQDSGVLKSTIAFANDAAVGAKAAKIAFSGVAKAGSWTNLFCNLGVGGWPAGGNVVSFWAKASQACRIRLKVNQGAQHDEWEFYQTEEIAVGTEWKKYTVPLAKIDEREWGHIAPPSGKVLTHLAFGIGFKEIDVPVEFFVDRIEIDRDPAADAR